MSEMKILDGVFSQAPIGSYKHIRIFAPYICLYSLSGQRSHVAAVETASNMSVVVTSLAALRWSKAP